MRSCQRIDDNIYHLHVGNYMFLLLFFRCVGPVQLPLCHNQRPEVARLWDIVSYAVGNFKCITIDVDQIISCSPELVTTSGMVHLGLAPACLKACEALSDCLPSQRGYSSATQLYCRLPPILIVLWTVCQWTCVFIEDRNR